jgi:hypothetical protein
MAVPNRTPLDVDDPRGAVYLIQQRRRFRGRLCVLEVQFCHGGAFSEKNRCQPSLSPASSLRLRLPFGRHKSVGNADRGGGGYVERVRDGEDVLRLRRDQLRVGPRRAGDEHALAGVLAPSAGVADECSRCRFERGNGEPSLGSDVVEMCLESGDEIDVNVVGLYAKLGLALVGI